MKKIIYLFIVTLFLTNVSCDSNFEEINISPNDSQVTDPNLLLSSTMSATLNILYNAQIGGDMGLCWAQHWSKVQYNDEEKYIPRRGNMNALWNIMYSSVIAEAKAAYELAEVDGNTNLQGISLVMQANAFQILTDSYGPVPFTEAVIPGNVKPVYDSEEVVYDGILALLDDAEALLASDTGDVTASADLIYGGNITKWRKFAASLKLKALMRISGKRNVGTEVTALINSGLLMSSNADSAQLVYPSAQPDANPIYETLIYGNRNEYKVSSVLVEALANAGDPRLAVYANVNNAGNYVGNIPGVENPGNYNGFSSPGNFYLDPTLPGVFLSYAQVEFLLAEAYNNTIVSGGNTMATQHYFAGITANLEFNGLGNSFISNPTLNFTTAADGKIKIGKQVWIALYGQGIEAWTEWRRTGQPSLTIVQNAAITSIPKRFYYSTEEQNYNQANYAAAISTLGNGDSMLSKVWWMN